MRILLIEDDEMVAAGISEGLQRNGFELDRLASAEHAMPALAAVAYDLAIVDLGLPGMDGMALIREMRRRGHALPVLILTARDRLEDRVEGLEGGGDDYLTKPFMLPELVARVRALIRRSRASSSSELVFGALQLDLGQRSAACAGRTLDLTGREWNVLEQMMLAAPRVVAKQKLADSLSRWDREITDNAVEIYVSRLRSKLADSGVVIRTVRGIGYRLEAERSDA